MSDFETCTVGTAKRLASLEPQPIVLPSLDEVREVLLCVPTSVMSGSDFYTDASQSVLDLIASRVPVWVPIEPGTVVKAGTRVREEYGRKVLRAEEWVPDRDFAAAAGHLFIDPRTVPAEPEPDPAVERVAKAIHDAEESDAEQWTCEPKDIAKMYGSYMPKDSLVCLNEAVIELTGAIEAIERAEAARTAAEVDEVTT